MQNHLIEAKQTLDHVLGLARSFSETHGSLVVLSIMNGNLDQAEKEMTIALKLDPAGFSGLYAKSLILNAQGNTERAQKQMKQLLQTAVLPDAQYSKLQQGC